MPDTTLQPSRAEMLSDSATYQRTSRGQRELLKAEDFSRSPALRILARVNGYSDLRTLVDLSSDAPSSLANAIEDLVGRGLIELVDPARSAAVRRAH